MTKRGKSMVIVGLIVTIAITGVMFIMGKKNKERQFYQKIEYLLNEEDYIKLEDLFYDIEKMEKQFGLTQSQCFEIIDYFDMMQYYKKRDYDEVYSLLRELNPKKCWIFEEDVKAFRSKFLNSKNGKLAKEKYYELEKFFADLEMYRNEANEERESYISKIAPYIGMSESFINDTMLGKAHEKKIITSKSWKYEESGETCEYEIYYKWMDSNKNVICVAHVKQESWDYEPEIKEVEYIGDDWEKSVYFKDNWNKKILEKYADEFVVAKYTGKIYSLNPVNNNKIEEESIDEMIEGYREEYDVYEYSDADEFYYDHMDDFEGYYDAEQYYDDAWSLIE